MKTIFVGGSRHASRLNADVRQRLDNIIGKGFPIAIGDANGADRAIQHYLKEKGYSSVEVYCSGGVCRNNVGNWRVRNVPALSTKTGVQFYSAKDRAMATEALAGFMLWDGKSIGTLLNVFRLLSLNKKVVLYDAPRRQFIEFRKSSDWERFVASLDNSLRRRLAQRIEDELHHIRLSQIEDAPMLYALGR